jgi:hypothetical protein
MVNDAGGAPSRATAPGAHALKHLANGIEPVGFLEPRDVGVASGNVLQWRGCRKDEGNMTSSQSVGDKESPLPAQIDVEDRPIQVCRGNDVECSIDALRPPNDIAS